MKFRMTVIGDVYGTVKPGDTIIVDNQRNGDYIDPNLVKKAVEEQLGKKMFECYHSGHNGRKWKVTKI